MGKPRGENGSGAQWLVMLAGAWWFAAASHAAAATNGLPPLPPGTNVLEEDIRGIRGPIEIPSQYGWVWWLLGLIAAAAIGCWLWRKFGLKGSAAKPAVIVPPHRRAKDRLRGAMQLLSDPYQFCSLVSDVVRVYLEERFDLHAPERTTEEFLGEMRGSSALTPGQKVMLEQFLTRCDLVKFARDEPTEEELKRLLDSAMNLIDDTAPAGEQATPQPAAEAARA